MSVKFLDSDHRLPAERRAELEIAFGSLMNAEYNEAFGLLESIVTDGDPLVRAFGFLYLGDLYHFQWDFGLSLQSYEKAVELFGNANHDNGRVMAAMRVADIHLDDAVTTDGHESLPAARRAARATLDAAVAEADEIGDDFLRAFGLHYRALFDVEDGDFAQAASDLERAIEIRDRIGDDVYGPSSMALLARATIELGDYERAVELAEQAFQLQVTRNIRGGGLRTLTILSYINEVHNMRRMEALTGQFTPVEPIARTPFLVSGQRREDLEVVAHSIDGPTPLMEAHEAVGAKRNALVTDSRAMVMMLQS